MVLENKGLEKETSSDSLGNSTGSPGRSPVNSVPLLDISGLHAGTDAQEILHGIDLKVEQGEIIAIMGPNGSGKSTLANTILGNPEYAVTAGSIRYKGEDITAWSPDVRAKSGIFMAFQHPESIEGLPVIQFLKQAVSARKTTEVSALEIRLEIMEWLKKLGMDDEFATRHLNEGFSGGERKRNEILQMALLEPDLAILDETDSGLDVDGLTTVASGVKSIMEHHPEMSTIIVTHYAKFLELIRPGRTVVLVNGTVVASGGNELAMEIDRNGYDRWTSR
jgi:Fe-S cluster assembly ATP-binding protein